MKRAFISISMVCLLAGCHSGSEESPDAPTRAAESGEAPADLDTIASLLRARHVEDLPSAEDLAKYPSAEASLQQLARTGESMLVRTRALALLRHFGSASTGVLLEEFVRDAELHPALRAAAVTGFAGQPLEDQPERLELVAGALQDRDPRVGLAAVEVLDGFTAGRRALRQANRDEMHAEVRAAIESQ